MKALSVRQPWAWAIVEGYKPVENRSRDIVGAYRGPVLIHAGREDAGPESWHAVRALLADDGHDPDDLPETLPLGGIVGRAEIADVVGYHRSAWFQGPVGIVLANAEPLKLIAWPGQLGLFDIDETRLALPDPVSARQGNLEL